MFSSGFFWKIYFTSAALVLLTALAIGLLTHGQIERRLLVDRETSLRHQCVRLAPLATDVFEGRVEGSIDALVGELAGDTGTRITLIRPDGSVLADTHEDAARMENHLGREELQEALASGWGASVRPSRTMGRKMFYVALTVGEAAGLVRLSIPVDDIDRELSTMRGRLLAGTLVGVIGAMLVGIFLARRISLPVAALTRVAEELRAGHYDQRLTRMPKNELGVLGDALNRLGLEVTQRLGELSGEEARLRAMLAGMVEGVVAVDEKDQVAFSNLAARKMFGLQDFGGRRIWEAVRIPGLSDLLQEARASDEAAQHDLVFTDDSGREMFVQAQAHGFLSEGRKGVVIVLHDLTEFRRLERVRRDFVANVSHELKTPLTSIRGYVETLLSGALHDQENNTRFLERIDANVKRLTHLVADLLSLARIESQEGLSLEPIEVVSVLEQTVRNHEARAAGKGITCVVDAPDVKVRILGDRECLVQVVDNLVDNAIKYTPEGGRVTLGLQREDGFAVLEVGDSGIGIPAEDLERVFERFYRVDKARSRELGGTGLGLAIVKHLTASMDGEVSVESEIDVGTTFRVRLPLSKTEI